MDARIVHTKIWNDPWFRSLEIDEKLYFLFLITNPYIDIIHLVELPDFIINQHTRINLDRLPKIKKKLVDSGKIDICDDYIFINNAYKYQEFSGIKNGYAKLRLIFVLSNNAFKHYKKYIITVLKQIIREMEIASTKITNLTLIEKMSNLLLRIKDRDKDTPIYTPIYTQPIPTSNKYSVISNQKSVNSNQKSQWVLDKKKNMVKKLDMNEVINPDDIPF